MANITAKDVMSLREKTGVGMMDCKKALIAADGDVEKAIELLREKGLATATKRASKIASEGIVTAYNAGNVYVLLEVNCESDFVAKGDQFKQVADSIAKYIAENDVATIEEVAEANKDLITEAIGKIGEKISPRRFVKYVANGKVDTYIHLGGKMGVIVEGSEDINDKLLHEIALHIAFAKPVYLSSDEVSPEDVEKEKKIAYEQALNEGKPAAIIEKMIPGRIQKFYKEVCLMEQVFIKAEDGKSTIKQVLKGSAINRFAFFVMGEGLEKKEENLADEVQAQIDKAKAGK